MTMMKALMPAVLAIVLAQPAAHADGGRIAWTGERGGVTGTIVVAPVAPRIGVVQLDWIGPLPEATAGLVRATHEYAVDAEAGFERRGPEEHHATLELLAPGRWDLVVDPDGDGPLAAVELVIEVGGPLPAWRTQWPWLFSWVPLTAIGWYAASRRRSTGRAAVSPR